LLVFNDRGEDIGEGFDDAEVRLGLVHEGFVVGEAEGGRGAGDAKGDCVVWRRPSLGFNWSHNNGRIGSPEITEIVGGAEGEVGDWRSSNGGCVKLTDGDAESHHCELHRA